MSASLRPAKDGTSAVARVEHCLRRIDEVEGRVHAWVRVDRDGALAAARQRNANPSGGLLHGIPVGIKDIIATKDLPTECGSPIRRGHMAGRNADCVERLLSAGAILLGKTVTTEFAHLHPGPTGNPHDPGRTPGGSSSGSAAAVAAGMVPLALGSQTGGSVMRPASFCGIFGFKSTVGRTDVTGVEELARSFDTVGWFARSAEELTLLARVLLIRPDYGVPSLPPRARIGVTMTPYAANASAETQDAVARAADALGTTGHKVEPVNLPAGFDGCNAAHRVVVSTEIGRSLAREWREQRALFSTELASFIEEALKLPSGAYDTAQGRIAAWRRMFDELMGSYDCLLCPSAAGEAPQGLGKTGDPVFNSMWSLLGAPCISLPFATGPSGIPVGIQLVGGRGRDEFLLALAERVTQQLNIQANQP
ncbi:MAG: amidase [Alphaproteobacteria bacterium]|nr:amidase [Alphaproteobacteria bacterium]